MNLLHRNKELKFGVILIWWGIKNLIFYTKTGERCEFINVTDDDIKEDQKACIPCEEGNGFDSYVNCINKHWNKLDISKYFPKECFDNGKRKVCTEALKGKFCLNGGKCEAIVYNS